MSLRPRPWLLPLLLLVLSPGLSGLELPGAEADSATSPSAANTLVWGPGLEANVVLPARFFFVQAVDSSGRNLTTSPGEQTYEVKIVSPAEDFARIWIQVLDRHDGSFLVRYRMYATYTDLHIHVLLKNNHVAKSPFILKGPVYHEGCHCPQPSGSVWEAHMHCPQSFPQIDRDLAFYPSVDLDLNAQEIPQRFGQRQSLCHYTVKDNREMLGELFTPIETPEAQNRGFLKGFFGGNSHNFDREELFGEASAGKASRSLAQHIPGQAGMEGMKVAASGVMGDLARARVALDERGQRLGELEDRTALMMTSAETFSKHAHELMLKCKDKKWYQL